MIPCCITVEWMCVKIILNLYSDSCVIWIQGQDFGWIMEVFGICLSYKV